MFLYVCFGYWCVVKGQSKRLSVWDIFRSLKHCKLQEMILSGLDGGICQSGNAPTFLWIVKRNAGLAPLGAAHHFIHLFGLTSSALGVWRGFLAPCRPLVLRPSPTIAHTWPNLVVPSRHLSPRIGTNTGKSTTNHTILKTFLWSFSESNSSNGKSTPMTRLGGYHHG